MTNLPPPSDYHLEQARKGVEIIMQMDDVTQWIEFLDGLHLPVLVVVVTLIVVAGGVAKAWIRRK